MAELEVVRRMNRLLSIFTLLLIVASLGAGEPQRTNSLKDLYGGPYADLPASSRGASFNFAVQLMKGTEESTLRDRPRLVYIFDTVLLPPLKPMQTGTANEKKVFEAAQKIRDAYLYVSDNVNKN